MNNYYMIFQCTNDHSLQCAIYENQDRETFNFTMIDINGEMLNEGENLTYRECFDAIVDQCLADAEVFM